jgi:hypothetical protein
MGDDTAWAVEFWQNSTTAEEYHENDDALIGVDCASVLDVCIAYLKPPAMRGAVHCRTVAFVRRRVSDGLLLGLVTSRPNPLYEGPYPDEPETPARECHHLDWYDAVHGSEDR